MKTVKENQTVILNRGGKQYLAIVEDIFTDCIGLRLAYNPDIFKTKEKNGVFYSCAVAFKHEISENKTGLTLK